MFLPLGLLNCLIAVSVPRLRLLIAIKYLLIKLFFCFFFITVILALSYRILLLSAKNLSYMHTKSRLFLERANLPPPGS